jgi:hypothetical protein
MGKHFSKSRSGTTLAEIITSLLIIAIIMGTILGLFFAIVKHMEQSNDVSTAQQHGESVIYLLQPKILSAGLGLPNNSEDLRSTLSTFFPTSLPLSDRKPILISGDLIEILYSVPSDAIASGEVIVSSADVTIPLVGTTQGLVANSPQNVSSWVCFPGTGFPLYITQVSPLRVRATGGASGLVYSMDRLHYLRVAKATISGDKFVMEDMSDFNPLNRPTAVVVAGIAGLLFQSDESTGTFTVSVLCKGQNRYDSVVSPEDIPPFSGISEENRHFRLKVVEARWRVRNYEY